MPLPRVDVGYGALMGAIAALVTVIIQATTPGVTVDWWTVLPPLLVVIVMGLVGYAFERSKEAMASLAGAVLIVIQAIISARQGEVFDAALLTTAVTAIVSAVFMFVIPRIQP